MSNTDLTPVNKNRQLQQSNAGVLEVEFVEDKVEAHKKLLNKANKQLDEIDKYTHKYFLIDQKQPEKVALTVQKITPGRYSLPTSRKRLPATDRLLSSVMLATTCPNQRICSINFLECSSHYKKVALLVKRMMNR